MGNISAAAETMALLRDCKGIEAVIMCGIAGGVPNPSKADDDVRLGDVVVPDRRGVTVYDHESVRERGRDIKERTPNLSRILLSTSRQLAADDKVGVRPWEEYAARAITEFEKIDAETGHRWRRPPVDTDVLYEFSSKRKLDYVIRAARACGVSARLAFYKPIIRPVDPTRSLDRPKIFSSVIASASKLQRNRATRDFLSHRYGAMAIDMESGGVGEAAFESGVEFFAVRAVSDYCNEDKSDQWQGFRELFQRLFDLTPASIARRSRPPQAFFRVGPR
ncbi:MAG: hypothetical protein A3F74_07870 [Betaproteobacteria bacterium RIFCSPLOWO2_12_FULL_62_58]|nr:MAG: hypothetical protein A3F74_07870 [Betaproteobacteria bacterium RIFCSPLOWO2_12_FULL_62_58]